jgi:hypothetical protein
MRLAVLNRLAHLAGKYSDLRFNINSGLFRKYSGSNLFVTLSGLTLSGATHADKSGMPNLSTSIDLTALTKRQF